MDEIPLKFVPHIGRCVLRQIGGGGFWSKLERENVGLQSGLERENGGLWNWLCRTHLAGTLAGR